MIELVPMPLVLIGQRKASAILEDIDSLEFSRSDGTPIELFLRFCAEIKDFCVGLFNSRKSATF
jgi:hypothetical protein